MLKRHAKQENAERRRKRWDLQRQRDLELLQEREALPQGRVKPRERGVTGGGRGAGGEQGSDTFQPDPEKGWK